MDLELTQSSPKSHGGIWKEMTGRKATISSQRTNSSSSVTSSSHREPPTARGGQDSEGERGQDSEDEMAFYTQKKTVKIWRNLCKNLEV